MEVSRTELLNVLTKIRPGIAKKEFLEQSTHFILNNHEIVSYNDEISIAHPFDIGVICTVDDVMLYKLISKMEEDTVEINLDKNTLKVVCGDINSEIPVITESPIFRYIDKLVAEQDDGDWKKLPDDFIEGIGLCLFSASTDKTLGTLTCVWIEGEDILSFDKYRASWYKMSASVGTKFYIEATYLQGLMDFEQPSDYCLSKSWAHFQMGNGVIYSARLTMPAELLPVKQKIQEFQSETYVSLPYALLSAIEAAAITQQGEEAIRQKVTIEIGEDVIRCIGKSERGRIGKEIHLDESLEVPPFSISASPQSLCQILNKATDLYVGDNKALFRSKGRENFRHMLGLNVKRE